MELIEDMKKISKSVKKYMADLEITTNGTTIRIDKELQPKIVSILKSEKTYLGKIRGVLLQLDLHGEKKEFSIYSPVKPNNIKCYFPENLEKAAIKAIKQNIEVMGTFHHKKIAKYPHCIDVENIRRFKPSELTLDDLKGIESKVSATESTENSTEES